MPWELINDILRGASPYAICVLGIIVVLYMYFKHKEKVSENSVKADVSEMKSMLSAHIGNIGGVLEDFKGRSTSEISLLERIAQELVRMNARGGEFISTDNAKQIIRYQWSWCKDQTARLLVNSIENNNFAGHEEVVVRRLRRAWKKVANDSKESIQRMRGLTYPYEPLYTVHIPLIWEKIFDWGVPLYYHQDRDGQGFKDCMSDLSARVSALFDHVLDTYFGMAEDVEGGSLYEPDDPRRSSGVMPTTDDAEDKMAEALRNYDARSSTDSDYDLESVSNEMKRRQEETDRIHGGGSALEPRDDEDTP